MTECPVWQCGGELKAVNSLVPLWAKNYYGENISWQMPSLICEDCKTVWHPVFKKENKK